MNDNTIYGLEWVNTVLKLKYSHYGAIWTENKGKIEQILWRKLVDAHTFRLSSTNTPVKTWQPRSVLTGKVEILTTGTIRAQQQISGTAEPKYALHRNDNKQWN